MAAPTAKPVPKVAAAGIAGIATTILIAVANQFGLELPQEVAAGLVAVVIFVVGYFKKDKTAEKPKLQSDVMA